MKSSKPQTSSASPKTKTVPTPSTIRAKEPVPKSEGIAARGRGAATRGFIARGGFN